MTATTATFQHFRKPQSAGLGGLGQVGTMILIGLAVVVVVLAIEVSLTVRPVLPAK